jgi:hypothetical protein
MRRFERSRAAPRVARGIKAGPRPTPGRNARHEEEIGREQDAGLGVQHRAVGSRVCGGVRREAEDTVAEIDLGAVLHLPGRVDHAAGLVCAENVGQPRPIEFAAGIEQRAKPVMADEVWPVGSESGRPEAMVRVAMGQHHLADRFVRTLRDLGAQPLPIREAVQPAPTPAGCARRSRPAPPRAAPAGAGGRRRRARRNTTAGPPSRA